MAGDTWAISGARRDTCLNLKGTLKTLSRGSSLARTRKGNSQKVSLLSLVSLFDKYRTIPLHIPQGELGQQKHSISRHGSNSKGNTDHWRVKMKDNTVTASKDKLTKEHYRWAFEALTSYAAYKVHGGEESAWQKEQIHPPAQWPQGVLPDNLEEFDGWPLDYEHGDYLLVRDVIGRYVTEYPQDASLPELIVHVAYYHRGIGEFWLVPSFGRNRWKLKDLGVWAIANAAWAINRVATLIAIEKMEQTKKVA